MSRLFYVSQYCCQDHNSEANPEEDEESSEVTVIARWIEVRHPGNVVDGVEYAVLCLRAGVPPGRRQ